MLMSSNVRVVKIKKTSFPTFSVSRVSSCSSVFSVFIHIFFCTRVQLMAFLCSYHSSNVILSIAACASLHMFMSEYLCLTHRTLSLTVLSHFFAFMHGSVGINHSLWADSLTIILEVTATSWYLSELLQWLQWSIRLYLCYSAFHYVVVTILYAIILRMANNWMHITVIKTDHFQTIHRWIVQ